MHNRHVLLAGVSDDFKSQTSQEIGELVKHEWTAVRLAPFPADYQATIEANGVRYRPSVPVIGWLLLMPCQRGTPRSINTEERRYFLSIPQCPRKIAEPK